MEHQPDDLLQRHAGAGGAPAYRIRSTSAYLSYWHAGKEYRETTKTADFDVAKTTLRKKLEELASVRRGLEPFIDPATKRVTVAELLDALDIRRTFAHNAAESGLDYKTIMDWTGHRTTATFMRYRITSLAGMRRAAARVATLKRFSNLRFELLESLNDQRPVWELYQQGNVEFHAHARIDAHRICALYRQGLLEFNHTDSMPRRSRQTTSKVAWANAKYCLRRKEITGGNPAVAGNVSAATLTVFACFFHLGSKS